VKYGIKSHKGMIRKINEDSLNVILGDSKMEAAFIVADGLGGHSAGEVASKMAVDYISSFLKNMPVDLEEDVFQDFVNKSVEEANAIIYEKSIEPGPLFGMGTTLVVAILFNKKMYIVHVGDSRAYMIRNGEMKQLTVDHSYIEELIKNGSLTRTEAQKHPKKNIITRALGCFEKVNVDNFSCDVFDGDKFILCTDGLTNMLSDDKIKDVVLLHDDPQDACNKLVEIANLSGGIDNITVIVIRI